MKRYTTGNNPKTRFLKETIAENKYQMEIDLTKKIQKEIKDFQGPILKEVHNMIATQMSLLILDI